MVVALLADFDGSDGLGLVKGVIYSACPDAKLSCFAQKQAEAISDETFIENFE